MKLLTQSLATLTLFALLACAACNKKNDEPELPPVTTTGAMTFGCKVNGKVFVPQDGRGKSGLICQYIFIDGGWSLNIPATNWKPSAPEGISITTDSLLLEEGMTYEFKNNIGTAQSFYFNTLEYTKLDNNEGSLTILKHDQVNRVLSGTFYFTGTNSSTGDTVSVTDGRFDIRY